MVDPSMVYRVASKRTADAALAELMANILSSLEHTTWAAVPLHLEQRRPARWSSRASGRRVMANSLMVDLSGAAIRW
jgi:hypothetical protein